MLIDTHCHLDYLIRDGNNISEVLSQAKASGVKKIITISTAIEEFEKNILQITQHSGVFCSIGTHPDNAKDFDEKTLDNLCMQYKEKIVAIGETGIDLYHTKNPPLDIQISSLEKHFSVAKKHSLPVVFHSRNAEKETIFHIKRLKKTDCIMHCFGGSYEFAKSCLDMGCYISFSGIVTFKNATDLQNVAKKIPLDRILIETDAPFLAPTPMRGKQNQPAFLKHTAEFLSDLLQMNHTILMHQIWENSHSAFPKISNPQEIL